MNITAVIVAVLLASVITAVGGFWLLPCCAVCILGRLS